MQNKFYYYDNIIIYVYISGSQKYEMLLIGKLCGKGKSIETYEECENASIALLTNFVFEPKLQRCLSDRIESKKSRSICRKGKAGNPTDHCMLAPTGTLFRFRVNRFTQLTKFI